MFLNDSQKTFITKKQEKRKLKKSVLSVALLAFTLSAIGCGIFPKEEETMAPPLVEPAPVVYEEHEVKRGNIEVTVRGYANFQSEKLYNESFRYAVSYLRSIDVITGDTVDTGQVLAEQETDSLINDLKKKQLKLKSDELTYNKIINDIKKLSNKGNGSNLNMQFDEVDEDAKYELDVKLEQQKIIIETDKIDIEEIQKSIDRSQLKASAGGTVVYVDTLNSGDKVTPNKTLVTIADPNNLFVKYAGDNMDKFYVGARVSVEYESKIYVGAVVTDQDNIPKDATEASKKMVKIKLDEMPPGAKIGSPADITLILNKKENVIVVPQSLVRQVEGRNYVELLENGVRVQKNVEIGLKNETEVEIVKGVNEGEKILK